MLPTDEQPFLDAILGRYQDDGPRLVYADFLDEVGTPESAARAELIRIQIALSHLPEDHPRRPPLSEREAELRQEHHDAWAKPFAGLVAGIEFRRGIPDSVSVDAATFLARGDDLFRATRVGGRSFIRRVGLLHPNHALQRLIHCPLLTQVAELNLCGGDLGNGGLNVLVRSPYLKGVRVLDLGFNGLDDAGARILAQSAAFPKLTELVLNDNGQITWDGVRAVAESPFLAGLTKLDLAGNDVNDAGVRAVAQGRSMARLHTLRLERNHIGDAGVAVLTRSPLFRRMLAQNPGLDLRANAIGSVGAEVLSASPELAHATALNLDRNYLGDRGVIALANCGRLTSLRVLRLSRNQVTDQAAFVLAAELAGMPKLRLIDLSGNRLTWRGVESLRTVARKRDVSLEVSGNMTEPTASSGVPDQVGGGGMGAAAADVAEMRRRVAHPSRRD